jgi:hypothetical protein
MHRFIDADSLFCAAKNGLAVVQRKKIVALTVTSGQYPALQTLFMIRLHVIFGVAK